MEFASSDPSVVRSIRQRSLLNTWLSAATRHHPLPLFHDFQPDRVAGELADMMGFDVVGQGDDARFLITQEGARLTATYGNEHVDPSKRTNRFLDDAIGPMRYAQCDYAVPHLPGAQAAGLFDLDGAGRRRQGRVL